MHSMRAQQSNPSKPSSQSHSPTTTAIPARIRLPRVRTGCLACKSAHVKCDERKPACTRCARASRTCSYPSHVSPKTEGSDGTPSRALAKAPKPLRQLLPASDRSRSASVSPTSTPTPTSLVVLQVPSRFDTHQDPDAALYFDRFQAQAAQYRKATDDSDDFWFRTLLRETNNDDCILSAVLSIGALAHALGNAPDHVSLFAVNPDRLPNPQHPAYRAAVRHYQVSIGQLRKRLDAPEALHQYPSKTDAAPTKQGSTRTLLISSILYSAFELMHGNSETADCIVAKSMSMLRSMILFDKQLHIPLQGNTRPLPTPPPEGSTIRTAGQYDDEGIEEAEWLLVRRATLGALYAPMHALGRSSILGLPQLNFLGGPSPPPLDASPLVYWKLYFRHMPMVALWYVRAEAVPIPVVTEPGSPHPELMDLDVPAEATETLKQLTRERQILIDQIIAWETAVLKRMERTEPSEKGSAVLLKQILPSNKTLRYCLETILEPRAGPNQQVELRGLAAEIMELAEELVNALPFVTQGRDEMRENAQSVAIRMSRSCRESAEIRQKALALCKRMVDSHSRWDVKGLIMGTTKLVEIEEAGRDPGTGVVPLSAQWDWTTAEWNADNTELKVVYASRTIPYTPGVNGQAPTPGPRAERRMTLRPADFGY